MVATKAEYASSDVLAEEAREKFLSRELVPLWAGRQGWRRGSAPAAGAALCCTSLPGEGCGKGRQRRSEEVLVVCL